MINLFNKTNDFIKSEKTKAKTCFADKDLSSWTGHGRSGHVQVTTFDQFGTLRVQNKIFDEISR